MVSSVFSAVYYTMKEWGKEAEEIWEKSTEICG